jgi:8-oxo-dGTP diphosphatase
LQLPGGHLEHGESFAECAVREAREETGLEISGIEVVRVTNDVFDEGKHYVTIFVKGVVVEGTSQVPRVCIPFLAV